MKDSYTYLAHKLTVRVHVIHLIPKRFVSVPHYPGKQESEHKPIYSHQTKSELLNVGLFLTSLLPYSPLNRLHGRICVWLNSVQVQLIPSVLQLIGIQL